MHKAPASSWPHPTPCLPAPPRHVSTRAAATCQVASSTPQLELRVSRPAPVPANPHPAPGHISGSRRASSRQLQLASEEAPTPGSSRMKGSRGEGRRVGGSRGRGPAETRPLPGCAAGWLPAAACCCCRRVCMATARVCRRATSGWGWGEGTCPCVWGGWASGWCKRGGVACQAAPSGRWGCDESA